MNMRRDEGAALVTVLVFLAVMAALAVVVVDAARFSVRRTANLDGMMQARWDALGAEAYAAHRIAAMTREGAPPIDQSEWQGRAFTFPVDDGALTVSLWDGSNCFNLNSVVAAGESGAFEASATGQVLFARLLDLVGVTAPSLPATLADWIDADNVAGAGGAEDAAYGGPDAPYRTGGVLIADMSELAHVRGFDERVIAAIAPYACVRPSAALSELNVNTLQPEQAILLSMMLGNALPPHMAQALVRARPYGGWADADDFWAMPQLAGRDITEETRALFTTRSTHYVLAARIARGDMVETEASLIAAQPRPRTLRRVFGAPLERPSL